MSSLLRFDVFTLFPEVFDPYLQVSILQRARQSGLVEVHLHNIRDWTTDRHHVTDDEPYGGGGGMVMKPEPIFTAVESVLGSPPSCPLILLTPQGRTFTQAVAQELALRAMPWIGGQGIEESGLQIPPAPPPPGETAEKDGEPGAGIYTPEAGVSEPLAPAQGRLALLCGRYEGVDERVRQYLVSDELSIGDYVLTGGELAALVVIDAVTRLIPGALGDPDGAMDDSHASGLLEYPHYTRPPEFRGWRVPDVLLSGDHARIARWRREQSLLRTFQRRPDLLEKAELTEQDRQFLKKLQVEG